MNVCDILYVSVYVTCDVCCVSCCVRFFRSLFTPPTSCISTSQSGVFLSLKMRVLSAYLLAVLGGNEAPTADDISKILDTGEEGFLGFKGSRVFQLLLLGSVGSLGLLGGLGS